MKLKGLAFLGSCCVFLLFLSVPSFSQTFPYYVLDGYGGVHAGGGAAAISPTTPYFGWDIAKSIDYFAVATSTTNYGHGILVLDGYGWVHKGGKLSTQTITATPYFGFNIARGLVARIIPPRANYSTSTAGNTTIPDATWVSMRSVTLRLPDDGYVFIAGRCGMGNNSAAGGADGAVALAMDSTTSPLDGIHAECDFPSSGSVDNWLPIGLTQMTYVTAGQHTFHFLARKDSGAGVLQYFHPTIAVIFIDQGYYGSSGHEVLAGLENLGVGEKH